MFRTIQVHLTRAHPLKGDKKMKERTILRNLAVIPALGLIPFLFIACAPAAVDSGKSQMTASDAQKESGVSLILGVKKEAIPPPPAPAAPRLAQTTPASYYEPVGPFFFYVETLTGNGPSKYGFSPTVSCIQSGVFKRGMRLVVRFEVLDTSTGKRVTNKDGANIKMILPHGEEVIARWTIRGSAVALPDSAWMWDTTWDIPPDYPVGTLDYKIIVTTKDGRTATFTPPVMKTPTADTRVRIID
jgi:hypothetical protein